MPGAGKLLAFQWFHKVRARKHQARTNLLVQRLREYLEGEQRRVRERFCPSREQVISEFERRGYPVEEIEQALGRLIQAGTLDDWRH